MKVDDPFRKRFVAAAVAAGAPQPGIIELRFRPLDKSEVPEIHEKGFEYRKTKHTRLDELRFLCDPDHDLKTRFGWALLEGPGVQPMVPPDDPRHPNNRQRGP